jgi:deoxyribonuclease-4
VAHGSLLINLASPEGRIRNSSVSSLLADLKVAAEVGIDAVCFHLGYAKGHASVEDALGLATRKLGELIERMPAGPRLLLENSCEGSELGQTIPEVAGLLRDVGAPPERFGLLIDTCHLHAAGFDLSGEEGGQRLADALAAEGVLERVVAFHLNDCQLPCGAHRDRHATPGTGTIGIGVASVARHPAFAALPGVLEISVEDARRGLQYLRQHGGL